MSVYAYRRIIDALDVRGLSGRDHGARAQYQCPAHEDRTPSLSVTDKPDRALLCCHAGCDTLAVLEALELEWTDLFDESKASKGWTIPTLRRVGAAANGDGRVELGGVRYMPGAGASERKTLAAAGAARDLWPDPSTVAGPGLFVVEGEPDAVTAAELGLPAVAVPGAMSWRPEWAQRIAEGRRWVVVIADSDKPGREAAKRCGEAVAAVCANVRVLDLAPQKTDGFDLSDLVAVASTDGERAQVRALVIEAAKKAPRLGVPSATPPRGVGTVAPSAESPMNTGDSGCQTVGTAGTLRRLDVRAMLTTEPEPVDWLIEGLVARGTLTLLCGREKEGKTMLAMACAARGVAGGGTLAGIPVEPLRVAFVDAENGLRELHRRLRSLGLDAAHAERIDIYEAVGHDLRRHLYEVEAILKAAKPDLVILDSWRTLWGGDENDSGEVSRVLDPLRNLIRAHNAGAILVHHMRKNGGYRGSSAIGASVENVVELSRHDEDDDRRRRLLRNPSCRYEQEADDRWLRIESDRARGVMLVDKAEPFLPESPARSEAEAKLFAALNGHPTQWQEWARDAGYDPKNGTARRARDRLQQAGKVTTDGKGWMRAGAA